MHRGMEISSKMSKNIAVGIDAIKSMNIYNENSGFSCVSVYWHCQRIMNY